MYGSMKMPTIRKYLALSVTLVLMVCAFGARPANAITFIFHGTCGLPAMPPNPGVPCNPDFGTDGSEVNGTLILNLMDNMMMPEDPTPGGVIDYDEFVSLTLSFPETAITVTFLPSNIDDTGSIGAFNNFTDPALAEIQDLAIFKFLRNMDGDIIGVERLFQYISLESGASLWSLFDNPEQVVGEPDSFGLPRVPEPASLPVFLFAVLTVALLTGWRASATKTKMANILRQDGDAVPRQ